MLEEPPREGEGLKIVGSAMIAHAASKEDILEVIKNDIYFKTDVWDMQKVNLCILQYSSFELGFLLTTCVLRYRYIR